jgi:hypothetical protein
MHLHYVSAAKMDDFLISFVDKLRNKLAARNTCYITG